MSRFNFLTGCIPFLVATIISWPGNLSAQNLVPNYSFEDQLWCPWLFNSLAAVPWQDGCEGSSDHFHICASPNYCGIPENGLGYQWPHTGDAYGGCYAKTNPLYREFLQAPLLAPLVAGQTYYLSLYISLADETCGTKPFGVHLSDVPPPPTAEYLIELTPTFENNGDFLRDYDDWMHLEHSFTASGGEAWITIGNFAGEFDNPLDTLCPYWPAAYSYYYVDDVVLAACNSTEELVFDLNGPVIACFEYTIDPGIDGTSYMWSDSSTGPTLTVYESGTYSVTIRDSCRIGSAEIEVTIEGTVQFALPDDTVNMCEGDVYSVSLNESLGDYTWSTGSTQPEIDISSAGTYIVTLNDGCGESADTVEVFVNAAPAGELFDDDTHLCPGEMIAYDFADIPGSYLWQDGSVESAYAITSGGTFAVTIANECGFISDEIEITFIPFPEVELGADVFLCANDFVDFDLDPDMGDYVWQDGTTAPYYTTTSPGLYAVTVTNVCGVHADSVTVAVTPSILLDLGSTIQVCPAGLPITIDASSPYASQYLWQDNSIASSYLVTSAGTYSVSVSNICETVVDTILVIVDNVLPNVQLPADTAICSHQTLILSPLAIPGTFLWQDGSTADTFTVNAPGIYSLSVTNECGTGSDSIVISHLSEIQTPDLGPNFTLCPGETFALHVQGPYTGYQWQDLSVADSFIVHGPGTFHVVVANQCTTATDTVVVTQSNLPPDVDLPVALTLCQGDSVLLEANISGVNYLWEDGSQMSSLWVQSPGTYSLQVTNSCGSDTDSVTVLDAGAPPQVELGGDVQICEGETVVITPMFTSVNNWQWQDGTSLPEWETTVAEIISIQVSNSCGADFDTMQVNLLAAIPPLFIGNDTAVCVGENLSLSITIPDVSINWSTGSQANSIVVDEAGSYYASISNTCGISTDTMVISSLPGVPSFNLGADQSLCPGEEILFDPGIVSVDYEWHDGTNGHTFVATTAGAVILQVSNACGMASDTVIITEDASGPQLNLGPDIHGCTGEEITIDPNVGGVDYTWHDGSTLATYTTNTSATVILTISNLCGSAVDTLDIVLTGTAPDAELGPDTVLCPGDFIVLSVPAGNYTIQWQDGSTGQSIIADAAQSYSVEVTNACGTTTDALNITLNVDQPFIALDSSQSLCPGETILLDATQLIPTSYVWNTGATTSSITVITPGTYAITLITACVTIDRIIEVGQSQDCVVSIYIPNVFSPNGDGINDNFFVYTSSAIQVISMEGIIYNRWGNVVFASNEIPFTWNGSYADSHVNPGVFVYRVVIRYLDGAVEWREVLTGDVTVIR